MTHFVLGLYPLNILLAYYYYTNRVIGYLGLWEVFLFVDNIDLIFGGNNPIISTVR